MLKIFYLSLNTLHYNDLQGDHQMMQKQNRLFLAHDQQAPGGYKHAHDRR